MLSGVQNMLETNTIQNRIDELKGRLKSLRGYL